MAGILWLRHRRQVQTIRLQVMTIRLPVPSCDLLHMFVIAWKLPTLYFMAYFNDIFTDTWDHPEMRCSIKPGPEHIK